MSRPRAASIALLACCSLAACGNAAVGASASRGGHRSTGRGDATGRLENVGLTLGGHHRSYLLYVPPGDSEAHRLPLLLVYHGAGDTAANAATETDLLSAAEHSHGLILVFPQGYADTWNEGAGHTPAERARVDDVAFTRTILQNVESHYAVDLRRVAATGLSNGALLTQLLGCRLARQLTLIVPVEGQLPAAVSSGCQPALPISVYEVHGTADQQIPYAGGPFKGLGGGTTVLSAPRSVSRWATLDHCASARRTVSGRVVLSIHSGCRDGVSVTLASIQGGQHAWPDRFAQTTIARAMASALRSDRRAARG
jgi:polyhydroxybutyrate depolymerase